MPNEIKYTTTNSANSIRKGNMALGINSVSYGPTSSTGWWNGIDVPPGGYVIYSNKIGSSGPSMFIASSDADLVSITNGAFGQNVAGITGALNYFAGLTDSIVVDRTYPDVVTDGLVMLWDPKFAPSFPRTGTTWYDISGNAKNGTLTNGPVWNSLGWVTLDGSNDYISVANPLNQSNLSQVWTVQAWINIVSNPTAGLQYLVNGLNSGVYIEYAQLNNSLLYLNSGANDYYTYGGQFTAQGWCLATFRFNNATGARQIWKNLTKTGDGNGPNNTSTPSGQGPTFYIGDKMNGKLGPVFIYNKYLSDAELTQNFYLSSISTSNLTYYFSGSNLASYDREGASWNDLKFSGVTGSLTGGTVYSEKGGGSFTFNGTSSQIRLKVGVNETNPISLSYPSTVHIWAKTNNGEGGLFSHWSGGPVNYGYYLSGSKMAVTYYDGQWNYVVSNGDSVPLYQWVLLTWILPTTATGNITMYINGVQNYSVAPRISWSTYNMGVFGSLWNWSYFNGDIGEVIIYNTNQNIEQIRQVYSSTRYRYDSFYPYATGGTVSTYTSNGITYRVHTFTSSGALIVPSAGTVDFLAVGGGGGGGSYAAGGGGGGGGIVRSSYYASAGETITVTVGAGGAGGIVNSSTSTAGFSSVFAGMTAHGGGRGGVGWAAEAGGAGGNGGGGGGYDGSGGAFTVAAGSPLAGQGNTGGLGRSISGNRGAGGGGGGGGGRGGDSTSTSGGNGGNGALFSLNGTPTYYAGGGGGGDYGSANGGAGGTGGGGNKSGGNSSAVPSGNGLVNTGGGGGGSRSATSDSWNGGNGGSGIVIVRYPIY